MKKAHDSVTRTWIVPLTLGLTIPLSALLFNGCKKDEPPPPLPSAAPANTPSAPLVLEVEDAGEDVEDADADADAKKVGTGSGSSMSRCCAAIQQNAANAPEPTKTYMTQAAATCYAAVKSGQSAGSISAIARGAGVSCK